MRLNELIGSRQAEIAVVGLGYVGLPLADAFHRVGFTVTGYDVDESKIALLQAGRSYLDHLPGRIFAELARSERFRCTDDPSALSSAHVVIVAVPTPLGDHQEPDLSYVEDTARLVGAHCESARLVVLESTTYPGTTRELFAPLVWGGSALSRGSGDPSTQVAIGYSPEREDPGREHDVTAVPKLVSALVECDLDLIDALYSAIFEVVVPLKAVETAEAAKLLENIYRSVNIALVNELKLVFNDLGINIWDVIEAASTKPYGFVPFYPGPGLGGHCIPIDPFYMSWKAKEVGRNVHFVELAGLVNKQMPEYVMTRLTEALNAHGKALNGSRILIIGLAYKSGVGDTRESPTYPMIKYLHERKAFVSFHDPLAPKTVPGREYSFELESISLDPETVKSFDAVVISTDQVGVDWSMIAEHAPLIVDTRNVMSPFAAAIGDNLVIA